MLVQQVLFLTGCALVGSTLLLAAVIAVQTPALARHELSLDKYAALALAAGASFLVGAALVLASAFDVTLAIGALVIFSVGVGLAISALRRVA